MIQSAEEFVALRCSEDPAEYQRATHEAAPEQVWLEVIERYPDMKVWVIHNKTVPQTLLRRLASDPDPRVRAAVGAKRKCEPVLLWQFAEDCDESVRLQVACNRKTPSAILQRLVEDSWGRVVEVAHERLAERGEAARGE